MTTSVKAVAATKKSLARQVESDALEAARWRQLAADQCAQLYEVVEGITAALHTLPKTTSAGTRAMLEHEQQRVVRIAEAFRFESATPSPSVIRELGRVRRALLAGLLVVCIGVGEEVGAKAVRDVRDLIERQFTHQHTPADVAIKLDRARASVDYILTGPTPSRLRFDELVIALDVARSMRTLPAPADVRETIQLLADRRVIVSYHDGEDDGPQDSGRGTTHAIAALLELLPGSSEDSTDAS